MSTSLKIRILIGALIAIVGGVWVVQGVGVLKGSFMTGEAVWVVIGAVVIAIGLAIITGARRAANMHADDG